MKYLHFNDLHEVPHDLREEFFLAEAKCWWNEPFNEFSICNDCGRLHSIQDLWMKPNSIGTANLSDFNCLDCGGGLSSFYLNDEFKKEAYDYFNENVWLILLLSERWDLLGFGLIVKKKIQDLLEYEFSTRPQSHNIDNIWWELNNYFWYQSKLEEMVLCIQHIYVDSRIRWSAFWMNILRKMFEVFTSIQDFWVVLETRYDSWLYPLTRSLGFSDVSEPDQYGYIVQAAKSSQKVTELLNSTLSTDWCTALKPLLQRYREEAKKVMQDNPSFSWKRFYHY